MAPFSTLLADKPPGHLVLEDQGHQEEGSRPASFGDLRRDEVGLREVLDHDGASVPHHGLVKLVVQMPESSLLEADLPEG